MSQTELIWGAFSLMVLGALVTMCMKCQRMGNTRDKTGQTEQHIAADCAAPVERERCSAQPRTHSLRYEDRPRWEMPNSYLDLARSGEEDLKTPYNLLGPSKSHQHPSLPSHFETRAKSRYQNLKKEIPMGPEAAYVQPISSYHYCNAGDFLSPSKEEESPSYENVSGPPGSNGCDSTNAKIYENSTIIQLWKHSPMQGDSSNDGGGGEEPDYINADLQRCTAA